MRLFVALDLDTIIRDRISTFAAGLAGFAPDARWVKPETLHVTLKFIGEQPDEAVGKMKTSLDAIRAGVINLHFRGYGFFPTAKAPRVFWVGIEAGDALPSLASDVDETLAALSIPKEQHAFSPHLTLARGPGGSGSPRWRKGDKPNRAFQSLQEKLAALPSPDFGTMTAREFFLYQSQLSPKGSKYTRLAAFALK